MLENLGLLYREYGGIWSALRSGYLRCAVLGTFIAAFGKIDFEWSDVTTSVMPSITGFTIAAFALIFAVLSPEQIKLLYPSENDEKSPLLGIMSSIVHAVVVQALSLILASMVKFTDWSGTFIYKIIISFPCLNNIICFLHKTIAVLGIFLTIYGLILVLAAVLSIFRMSSIASRL